MRFRPVAGRGRKSSPLPRLGSQRNENGNDDDTTTVIPLGSLSKSDEIMTEAATNTINERLMAELVQAENKERFGKRSTLSKKSMGISPFGSMLSDEERQMAIEEARNLNGVNPVVAMVGGLVGLTIATGLWFGTSSLGTFFALHPVDTDVYFIVRVTSVFRNIVMGLSSLASGFFGVTGMGILALGIRVAYGVMTGELDPTPIKTRKGDANSMDIPNVWDLMMNKKPNQRRNK